MKGWRLSADRTVEGLSVKESVAVRWVHLGRIVLSWLQAREESRLDGSGTFAGWSGASSDRILAV